MTYLSLNLPMMTFGLIFLFSIIALLMLRRKTKCRLTLARQHSLGQIINLKNLIKLSQKHRGISYRVLNSDPSRRVELVNLQRQIESLLSQLNELNDIDATAEYWTSFCDHWSRLQANNLAISADNNLEQHNRLISVLLAIVEDLIEYGHWHDIEWQDQNSQIHQLTNLLTAAEWIGQARALGSGILASGNSTSVERIRMNFLKSKLLEHTHISDQFIQQPLMTMVEMIDQNLLAEGAASISSNEYFEIASRAIDILMENFDRSAAELTDNDKQQVKLYSEESAISV